MGLETLSDSDLMALKAGDLSNISDVGLMSLKDFRRIKGEGVTRSEPPKFTPSGEKSLPFEEPGGMLGHPSVRAARGALGIDAGLGLVQLGANAVGMGDGINRTVKQLEEDTKRAREDAGSTGFDWWNLAGNVASLPAAGLAKALPTAETAGARILQGAGVGAVAGATTPVADENYWSTKGLQTAGGAVAGALLPGAWELTKAGGRGVRNVVQPYLGEWGADRAAGRLGNLAAGDKGDEVVQALLNSKQLVPGSAPTAGQAASSANSAEFSALQKAAADRAPSAYYGPGGIEGQQNAARVSAVRSVGGTSGDLSAAVAQRGREAGINYRAAYQEAVKGDAALMKMSENPYFKDALGDATKLAEAKGINPKEDLTQFLHYVKISLDKQLGRTGDTALASTEKQTVQTLKKELTGWMEEKNPLYDAARAEFARASKPINQMEVGQELEKRLVPALSEDAKQRSAVYANALRDAPQTIKKATGQPRFAEMSDVMTPPQMDTLTGVQRDLARNAVADELARKGATAANKVIGTAVPEMGPTGMFSPKISVARAVYNRLTGHATDKILNDLSVAMQDPQKMAKLMQDATPFERSAIIDAVMKAQGVPAAKATQQGEGN